MNIEWISQEKSNNAITIYNNNITFSKQAANCFADAYGIAVGFDKENQNIVMKRVTQEDVNNKIFSKEDIYNLTMKPSFGRINSKKLIVELSKYIGLDFSKKVSYKFSATYNTGTKMLIIDAKEALIYD